ncbi:hypothetical protein BN2497_13867 [Janthinobacterium sp. CG23_2]|nr:hypothetical protein BN2497_13867 [Janthinobacterium sp. CG23_2]CUU33331.1 hypothetical protein BN3177_13867 [Janthinobacterium sp. CG23_2]
MYGEQLQAMENDEYAGGKRSVGDVWVANAMRDPTDRPGCQRQAYKK